MAEYFIRKNGKLHGPFDAAKLKKLATAGKFSARDEVRKDDGPWKKAGTIKALNFEIPVVYAQPDIAPAEPVIELDPIPIQTPVGLDPLPPANEFQTAGPAYLNRPKYKKPKSQGGSNVVGMIGFIISIIAIFTCGLLSPISGILSAIGCFRQPKGLAIAGLVISGMGLTIFLFYVVFIVSDYPRLNAKISLAMAKAHVHNFYVEHSRCPDGDEFRQQAGNLADSIQVQELGELEFRLTHCGADNEFGTNDDMFQDYLFDHSAKEFKQIRGAE